MSMASSSSAFEAPRPPSAASINSLSLKRTSRMPPRRHFQWNRGLAGSAAANPSQNGTNYAPLSRDFCLTVRVQGSSARSRGHSRSRASCRRSVRGCAPQLPPRPGAAARFASRPERPASRLLHNPVPRCPLCAYRGLRVQASASSFIPFVSLLPAPTADRNTSVGR